MTVSTSRTHMGEVIVRISYGCTQRMTIIFKTRHDAAVFLQAMRKRVR